MNKPQMLDAPSISLLSAAEKSEFSSAEWVGYRESKHGPRSSGAAGFASANYGVNELVANLLTRHHREAVANFCSVWPPAASIAMNSR
jgi:hypothetical protein